MKALFGIVNVIILILIFYLIYRIIKVKGSQTPRSIPKTDKTSTVLKKVISERVSSPKKVIPVGSIPTADSPSGARKPNQKNGRTSSLMMLISKVVSFSNKNRYFVIVLCI